MALIDNVTPTNQIVHRSNDRLMHDVEMCARYQVPIAITSLGAREEVNQAVHDSGGIVLHDIINDTFARKAVAKGADGLVAVAAGAGGHAGTTSPFALVSEIRAWFDGPVALSGAIATGGAVLAAQAMGADFGYVGSAFIATVEANAPDGYKRMLVEGGSGDIVYTNLITGVHGNYLRGSIIAAGMDPDNLPVSDPSAMNFGGDKKKAWKDIWGSGQGIAAIHEVVPVAALVARLTDEYEAARRRLGRGLRTGPGRVGVRPCRAGGARDRRQRRHRAGHGARLVPGRCNRGADRAGRGQGRCCRQRELGEGRALHRQRTCWTRRPPATPWRPPSRRAGGSTSW